MGPSEPTVFQAMNLKQVLMKKLMARFQQNIT